MFTASRCLSCPCYLELIAFSKSVCSFCFARENTCVRLIVSVHIFLHLFTIFGAFQCVNVQEMLLCAVVCMHLYAAHCFWRVTGSRLVLGLISHSCIWCKWPNPLDFPFKLSGHISRLNDRSTSWQSLWEAESAIKSERRLKREQLQPTRFNIWCKVQFSVCSINIKIDSPRLHDSVMKGRCLKYSNSFTWTALTNTVK